MHPNAPNDKLFTLFKSRPNSLVWWTEGRREPSHDKNAYMTLQQWQSELSRRMRTGLQSLHLKPNWEEFLVLDIDVRATTVDKSPEEIRSVLGCTHLPSAPICAKCWPIAQAACLLTDEWITKNFGLPTPLTVFSGSGGVHLWYNLRHDADASIAFSSQCARDALVQLWNASPLPETLAAAVPLYGRADAARWRPQIDTNVTAQQRHAIRMPFSRNSKTERHALPLPHSRTPEWPETDDIATATQCFTLWAEFAPMHVAS